MYIAVVDYGANKRIGMYWSYEIQAKADAHVKSEIKKGFTNAFVAKDPGGGPRDWLVDDSDPDNKTLSNSPDLDLHAAEAQKVVLNALLETDKAMARLTEDIIDWVVNEGGFDKSTLPQTVQDKLAERKVLRDQLR